MEPGFSDRFNHFFDLLLGLEGERNTDQGGDTVHGISRKAHPDETPWPPTLERVQQIYYDEYYQPMRCDEISDAHFAFQFFVAAVNIGAQDAKKHIWTVLLMPLTGQVVGRLTIDNLNAAIAADCDGLYARFLEGMVDHYFNLAEGNPERHGSSLRGWIKRLIRSIDL